MAPTIVARVIALALLALAYAGAVLWFAATGTGDLMAPFGWGTMIVAPAAAGLLLSLTTDPPRRLPVALGAPLICATAAAIAVTMGWLPLAYFASAGPWLLAGALAGGLVGPILPDIRIRSVVAMAMAIAPVLLGRLEGSAAQPDTTVTVSSLADVAAPSIELWEAIIDIDSTRIAERAVESEDGEWRRVALAPQVIAVPRGLAAWRAPWETEAVVPVAATYELMADGDSTSTLKLDGTWRLAIHERAYPPGWLQRVAQRKNDTRAALLRSGTEARVRAAEPSLSAEMKLLRAQLVADLTNAEDLDAIAPVFLNGDRAIEIVDGARPPVSSPEEAQAALRMALRGVAMRARTTGLAAVTVNRAPGDSSRVPNAVMLEFEDFHGRCVQEVLALARDAGGRVSVAPATTAPQSRVFCLPDAMAERARRARVIAQLALSAGEESDTWSVALLARGMARVYLDSVVIRTDTLRLRVNTPDGADATVDSIVVGLSQKTEQSWYMTQRGGAIALHRTFRNKEEWNRPRARFTIPADSSIDLTKVWPTFEVVLSVPKTESNTVGRAWTYSHTPMAFFSGTKR